MEDSEFPMRINKYLAHKGYSTRRGADELIEKRIVFINGRVAVLGDKVEATDKIEVKLDKRNEKRYAYYAYYKPIGVTTHSPQAGEQDVLGTIPKLIGVFPIGRLDKNSHGLMILTNDGRITDRLLNPEYIHEKEYAIITEEQLRPSFKKYMEAGVNIGDYTTKRCKVTITGERSFRITLTEGKRHQIRRMCSALHVEIRDLKRTRIMNIKLGKLKPGEYRPIEGKERPDFLKSLGIE